MRDINNIIDEKRFDQDRQYLIGLMNPTDEELNECERISFEDRFAKLSDQELIETFNSDVAKSGWVSSRGRFYIALRNEFDRRGFDYSAIGNKSCLSLKYKAKLIVSKILVPLVVESEKK